MFEKWLSANDTDGDLANVQAWIQSDIEGCIAHFTGEDFEFIVWNNIGHENIQNNHNMRLALKDLHAI
jgi:hypothetical protein